MLRGVRLFTQCYSCTFYTRKLRCLTLQNERALGHILFTGIFQSHNSADEYSDTVQSNLEFAKV